MKTIVAALALLAGLAVAAPAAVAMGGDTVMPKQVDTKKDYEAGKMAVQSAQYDKAIELMKKVVAADPKNADAYNYLGFANRKKGDVKNASMYYETALKLDAKHKGALEYQGELFLKMGKMDDVMKNRARLAALCPSGCAELAELDRAIADHKASGGAGTGSGS